MCLFFILNKKSYQRVCDLTPISKKYYRAIKLCLIFIEVFFACEKQKIVLAISRLDKINLFTILTALTGSL
jgi:hypothetical protein